MINSAKLLWRWCSEAENNRTFHNRDDCCVSFIWELFHREQYWRFSCLFSIASRYFLCNGYYRLGLEVFGGSQTGSLRFTPTMLYAGPALSYSGALGKISGLEAGIDGRLVTGIESLSFNLFGRRYMLSMGLRGQFMFSFYESTDRFKTRLSPEMGFIDVTKMTDRFKFSLLLWPLPVLLRFDMYF